MRNDNKLERFQQLFELFRATYPESLIAVVQFNYKTSILVVQSQWVNGRELCMYNLVHFSCRQPFTPGIYTFWF